MTHYKRGQTALNSHTLSTKGKRLSRLFAVLLIGAGVLAGIASPAAAENDPARIDGNTYFGLEFGWSVSWDETVWTDPYETHSDGFEYVALNAAEDWLGATARVVATNAYGGDVDKCVEQWDDALESGGLFEDIERTELDQGIDLPPDAAEGAYTYNMPITDDPFIWVEYVQCRPLSDGVNLVVTLSTVSTDYEEALPIFADLVDGLSVDEDHAAPSSGRSGDAETGDRPGSDDENSRRDSGSFDLKPGGRGVDGNSYTGINFDWSVSWNERYWELIPDQEFNSGGVDAFAIKTIQPFAPVASVMFQSTSEYGGDVIACAEASRSWLEDNESMSDIAIADVELPAVPSDGAVTAFSYIYERSMALIAIQVCLPLDSMGATLMVSGVIPIFAYDAALPYFIDLTDAISINLS